MPDRPMTHDRWQHIATAPLWGLVRKWKQAGDAAERKASLGQFPEGNSAEALAYYEAAEQLATKLHAMASVAFAQEVRHDAEDWAEFDDALDAAGAPTGDDYRLPTIDRLQWVIERAKAAEAKLQKVRESLTPSAYTKSDYRGEFSFNIERTDDDGNPYSESVAVPWTTIKEIMAAILQRAALAESEVPK